ncbi:MAG: SPOR domain-containing protein [Magnetococcales bacterium]|nr:SPOR domain-containing protein [Magnetococcales bacterium]
MAKIEPRLDDQDASGSAGDDAKVQPIAGPAPRIGGYRRGSRTEAGVEAVWYGKKPYAAAPMETMENVRGVGLVCRDKAAERVPGIKGMLRSKIWNRLGKSLVWSLVGWCLAVGALWALSERYRIPMPMVGNAAAAVVHTAPRPSLATPFSRVQAILDQPALPDWGRYEVLAGTFVDPLAAGQLHRRLLAIGGSDYWRSGFDNGRPRIQVLIGPFARSSEAEQAAKRLHNLLGVEGRVVAVPPSRKGVAPGVAQALHPLPEAKGMSDRNPVAALTTTAAAGGGATFPRAHDRR